MPLLSKDGKLASIGGALKRFVAGCIDKCCGKWYCHTGYYCDQDEAGHISEHSSEKECYEACREPDVEHYCHEYSASGGGGCDTDPTDALATYPSLQACEEACDKWYCCYLSYDFSKGSTCQKGLCPDAGLTRGGPYEDKEECEPECESKYYCVIVTGPDAEEYTCVTDASAGLELSGPYNSYDSCADLCDKENQKPYVWCVNNMKCVESIGGPPEECGVGVFCEQYDDFIQCGLGCLDEQWYCVLPGECLQLQTPPANNPQPYDSEDSCLDQCQQYYCCWLSGDYSKGSECQIGECSKDLYRSGPYDYEGICDTACERIFCWSYKDVLQDKTIKVCQEEAPLCPDPPGDCEFEDVTKVSGPYGLLGDCMAVCYTPTYAYLCTPEYTCEKCCLEGDCPPEVEPCPEDGAGVYDLEEDCEKECKALFWACDVNSKSCVEKFEGDGDFTTFEECFPLCCDDDCVVPSGTCPAGDTEGWATLTRPDCLAEDELSNCMKGGDGKRLGEALSDAGWNVVVDNGDSQGTPDRTKGCCDCDGKNHTSVYACCDGEVGPIEFYLRRNTTDAPCDGEWEFDANSVISLAQDEEGEPAFKLYPCIKPPPCPPETCTVTLYAAITEPNGAPYWTLENLDKALKITVECKHDGFFSYSGSVVPPGASHPVTANVSVWNNAWQATASISGGGFTSATQLNLPIPGAQQIVPDGGIPNIAFLSFDGRPEQIGNTPDDTLPDPAMTIDNVCKGITTYKLPAFRYPELGPVGQIWAGYKWLGSNEYFPYFAASDGYDGAPLTYIEVEFKPQNKSALPAPPSVLALAP